MKSLKLKTTLNTQHEKTRWILENSIPGSKYLANRALIIAALSAEPCRLGNLPDNEDIRALYNALVLLGYPLQWDEKGSIHSQGSKLRVKPEQGVTIDCGASGTMARFISAVVALDDFPIQITGSARLCERPMAQLFDALQSLTASITEDGNEGCLPVTIKGPLKSEPTTTIQLPGSISSQYASALILVGSQLENGLCVELLQPIVSSQYIKMTCDLVQSAGIELSQQENIISIKSGKYHQQQLDLNADPCSASYPLAAAAITGREIIIKPFQYLPEQQGEFAIIDLLKKMGCEINCDENSVRLTRNKPLTAITENMSDKPDIVQTLAVVACFAEGTSRFEGISHLRFKESDRIVDTVTELRKIGVEANYGEDWLEVTGSDNLQGAKLTTHHDHRMAMSLAQLAWKIDNIEIEQPEVVAKSFPRFWELMETMGLTSR